MVELREYDHGRLLARRTYSTSEAAEVDRIRCVGRCWLINEGRAEGTKLERRWEVVER